MALLCLAMRSKPSPNAVIRLWAGVIRCRRGGPGSDRRKGCRYR